jgi:hypothetical protein
MQTTTPCWAAKTPPQIAAWTRAKKYRSIKLRLRLTAQYFCDIIGDNFSMGRHVVGNKLAIEYVCGEELEHISKR